MQTHVSLLVDYPMINHVTRIALVGLWYLLQLPKCVTTDKRTLFVIRFNYNVQVY